MNEQAPSKEQHQFVLAWLSSSKDRRTIGEPWQPAFVADAAAMIAEALSRAGLPRVRASSYRNEVRWPAVSGKFFILSLKHTAKGDDYITLWQPDDRGYTLYIPYAGLYTLREIEAAPDYYNNRRTTVAIPSLVINSRGIEAAPGYDCPGPVLRNTDENWKSLLTYRHGATLGDSE